MSEKPWPWREWPEYKRLDEIVGHDRWLDDLCARVWREAYQSGGEAAATAWDVAVRQNLLRAQAAEQRADRLAAALRKVERICVRIFERQGGGWGELQDALGTIDAAFYRAALADNPKEVT